GSPDRKLTERDREIIDALIKDLQGQFVSAVASGRNLSVEKVQEFADGRIFSGARAKDLGLVDFMGNFQDTVEITKKIAGIKGDVALVYPKKSTGELWDLFLGSSARNIVGVLTERGGGRVAYRWNGL
ncbi:MAG: S49 family peptidase, partial [Deltaproteobacteria bacterium]|nr:S49 family peptidase [Deltaproteobacteria bacterium]